MKMSYYATKLKNKECRNWVSAHLAVSEAKAGLQDVVCDTLQVRHQKIIKPVTTQTLSNFRCSSCYTQTIICCSLYTCNRVGRKCSKHQQFRPCPNGVCDNIRDRIITDHRFFNPSWKNTRAELWNKFYWEYAKCFMPLEGYSDKNAYSETDLNGIISILLNQNDFVNEVDDSICHKARHLLNNLRHNSDMLLSDQMLEDVVCTLQQLLSCCESFKNYSKTSDARAKLEQLKAGSFALPEGYGQQCLQSQILTNDLIQFNKDIHGTIPISPLFEDIDMAVPDVYVQPTINRVLSGCPNAKKGQRTARISSLREIFHDQNGPYREIYLCAETGLGKSVFGKRLALIWSQANESDKIQRSFTQDEIDAINYFDSVFYISLKESDQTHIDVDEMIQQQIIGHLAHATHYSPEFLEHILSDRDRKCLIILDGLDEWSHEKGNIPMRRPRQSCTFLTTTRPWRYTVARIKQSKIDLQLEMIGIDKEGKQALIANILKHFGSCDDQLENSLKEFEKKVARRNVNDLETSPMLLLYMVCLWQDGKPLGDSRCDLYCNI